MAPLSAPRRRKKQANVSTQEHKSVKGETSKESTFQKVPDNNNTFQKKNEEVVNESSTDCKHLKNCGTLDVEAIKQSKSACCSCNKPAHMFCIHEKCLRGTITSCCENVGHILGHVAMNDHPVIFHHGLHVIICTQCSIQIDADEYISQTEQKAKKIDTTMERRSKGSRPFEITGLLGFVNFGNTCYMNSVFQLLAHCSPFVEYFTKMEFPREMSNVNAASRSTVMQLALDLRVMWSTMPVPFISPWRILHCIREELPGFDSFQQQDAAEFMRSFLDILDRELKVVGELHQEDNGMNPLLLDDTGYEIPFHAKKTIINDTFQGTLENQIQCHNCGYRSRTFEHFLDLSVPILTEEEEFLWGFTGTPNEKVEIINKTVHVEYPREGDEGADPGMIPNRAVGNKTTLNECLDRYFGNTKLNGDNKYSCSDCKTLANATKTTIAVKLPEVVFIQLKRFWHTMYGVRKVDKTVEFPVRSIDLGSWTSSGEKDIYDLIGFVVHDGYSVEYGHYVAYCRHEEDNMWYKFDDVNIKRCEDTRVAEQQPYILMFKRRHNKENDTAKKVTNENDDVPETADQRYMEQCPSGWRLLETAFAANDKTYDTEEQKKSAEAKKARENEMTYNELAAKLEELEMVAEEQKSKRYREKHRVENNVAVAIKTLNESMEMWLENILMEEWKKMDRVRSEAREIKPVVRSLDAQITYEEIQN